MYTIKQQNIERKVSGFVSKGNYFIGLPIILLGIKKCYYGNLKHTISY